MILADKIITLRKRYNWSQEELAMKLNISRQSVSKWESGTSVPDLDKIITLSQIFGVSTDYLLKDGIELDPLSPQTDYGEEGLRHITVEEANEFMSLKKKMAPRLAVTTALFLFAPIPLIVMGGLSEYTSLITEDVAGGLGSIILLLVIGGCVASYILNGMQQEKYEYLEKESFNLLYGIEGIVRKKQDDFAPIHRSCTAIATTLCICSVIPLLVAAAFNSTDLIYVLCVAILLALIGVAVYLYCWSGDIFDSFQILLQEGEFTEAAKREKKRMSPYSVIYWCIITAIYLGISFYTSAWKETWIIWPVSGVFYVAFYSIVKLMHRK